MKSIRVEARLRNNILWHLIFDRFDSVADFCREAHVSQSEVGRLLNLSDSAKTKDGEYRVVAQRIAQFFVMTEEDIFPDSIYGLPVTKAAIEVDPIMLPMTREVLQLPDASTPEINYAAAEIATLLRKHMECLSEREADIVCKHHGIDCDPMTLDAIGHYYHVNGERIRQIEERALGKLKYQFETCNKGDCRGK